MELEVTVKATLIPFATISLVSFASCQRTHPDLSATAGQPVSVEQRESSRLDRITTLETVFPNASDRALYELITPATDGHQRSYSFALKQQVGMEVPRHFQLLTITWLHPAHAKSAPATSSTGGPNGGFVEKIVHTPDGAYEIRITLGELLPETVRTATVDFDQIGKRLLDAYPLAKSNKT
ncbi:MAG: hypothetical protein H7039_24015 [Bryobacteraceae bacterium]|nr:hypothetical protein [Bryobacteraceae bacterium]